MIVRKISLIMFALNASVSFLAAAGSEAVWGIKMETGIGDTIEAVNQATQSVGSGPVGLIEAAAGAVIAAMTLLSNILVIVFAAPTLFLNLGIPSFIVTFIFAPLYLVVGYDIIAIFRGDSGI